jgi:hypothetical protein
MDIKVNIPKNDYVQPTEVRQEIVQMICDFIIKRMEDKHFHEEDSYDVIIGHHEWFYQLYLGINRKSNTPFSFSSSDKHCVGDVTYIRIRTAEMQAVFTAIQDAGYYIFGRSNITGRETYIFTKKPYYDNRKAERMEFSLFID